MRELEDLMQNVGRATLSPKSLGEKSPLFAPRVWCCQPSLVFLGLWQHNPSLTCVFTWLLSLYVCVCPHFPSCLRTPVIGLEPHLDLIALTKILCPNEVTLSFSKPHSEVNINFREHNSTQYCWVSGRLDYVLYEVKDRID